MSVVEVPELALTLIRPWPFAMLHLDDDPKRIENRDWKPWPRIIGRRIALHAGRKYDESVADHLYDLEGGLYRFAHQRFLERGHDEGIVGTALVCGWVEWQAEYSGELNYGGDLTDEQLKAATRSRWFFGRYGWVLDDVRALKTPITCKGKHKLWTIPQPVREQIPMLEAA